MNRPPLSLYVEAAFSLLVARADVVLRPARRHFAKVTDGRETVDEQILVAIRRTLTSASHRLPIRAQCYEQALAARAMLARRGVKTKLHFGGGKQEGALTAHVWLTAGDQFVVGEEAAGDHSPLFSSD